MILPDPTHQPTHPPTHPPNYALTHGWGILHRLQIFKRNWNILISSSVIKILPILGVPPGGWQMGGWGRGGYGYVGGVPCTHTHMHVHARTHARTCMLNMINMINMDTSMSAAICNFHTCVYVCVHVCTCVHMCVVTPPTPQMPPDTPHPPAPPSRAKETQIGRITITLERIEIIQFCLKICDPWTLLHTYRLSLMCRWGVYYPKWHFHVFDPKKYCCDPPIKKFSIFALDPIRPYLDWALRGFLTS